MLGIEVNRNVLNTKVAQAIVGLREAFEEVETINKWLTNHSPIEGTDPLTLGEYGFTDDEVYALRVYFETFDAVRIANASTFDTGRKMTGLE